MSDSSASFLYDAVEPSPVEAEEHLTIFHTHKSKYFPFVYVPSTTTAQQLRQEQPFSWLCIMTMASGSTSQQQVLGSKMRDTLAQEMLLGSDQSIDLLIRLLAYVGWYGVSAPQNYIITGFLPHKLELSDTDYFLSGSITRCKADPPYPSLHSLPHH